MRESDWSCIDSIRPNIWLQMCSQQDDMNVYNEMIKEIFGIGMYSSNMLSRIAHIYAGPD